MTEARLLLINPPKKVKKMARTKASRSASAKKAAATRKRNAAKRSAAAKKAAATRKRNGRKAPAKRSTAAKRSAAAKKAAATRKRNAAKRSTAAKKAAATRKRNGRKSPAKRSGKKTTVRSTKAKRSAAAKKAAATRKRNAAKRSRSAKKAAATRKRNGRKSPAKRSGKKSTRSTKAKRSAAAKKAWRTRRRNGTAGRKSKGRKSPARRRSRRKASNKSMTLVSKAGKNTYASVMNAVNSLPGYAMMGMYGALAIGAYNYVKPYSWDMMNIEGYINSAGNKIGNLTTANIGQDVANFTNKAIAVGTIAALGHLVSSKKALGVIDPKLANSAVGVAGLYFGAMFLTEIQTLNVGNAVQKLTRGDFKGGFNSLSSGTYGTLGQTGPAGGGGMSQYNPALPMFGAGNLGMAHNGNAGLLNQQQLPNAATSMGSNQNGFFGTGKSLGATRVNLF
jgi:hypothetical protein